MILTLLAATALFLALNNGANDNFKGFATVWGSASLSFRTALILANAATLAGGIVSIILADGLIKQFSGRGLVEDAVVASAPFALSVASGAGITVALATRLGFPISTTHAIVGGLIGSALSSGETIAYGHLGKQFILPLLTSPIIAALLGFLAYTIAARIDNRPSFVAGLSAAQRQRDPVALTTAHIISAITICFARAVNDTPKLAALLLGAGVLSAWNSAFAITAAMVLGGLLLSRRVAETMSLKLSEITSVQGTAANIVTSAVVLTASSFALPVSTTHVSVGSIIGSGKAADTLDLSTVRNVLLSWVVTLPVAIITAALLMQIVQRF
jgi:inorganic phosphate transporter, PiT family